MEVYGLWAVIGIFAGMASVLDLGIYKSIIYLILQQRHGINELASTATFLSCMAAVTFTVLLIILQLLKVHIFGSVVTAQGNLAWWLALGGCIVLFSSLFTNVARATLEASFFGHVVNVGFAFVTLLQYGVAAIVSHWYSNPRALIAGSVCVYVLILLGHVGYLQKVRRIILVRPTRSAMAAIFRYGLTAFAADLPIMLLGPTVSYLFVLTAIKAGEYGVFDISFKIAMLAASALSMLATPLFAIAASAQPGNRVAVRQTGSRYLGVTVTLGCVGCVLFWLFGDRALALFFFNEHPHLIFRTSLLMLIGATAAAALEPVARMLMGIGCLGRLSLVRYAMLGTTMGLIALLTHLEPLNRFALAVGIGFGTSAVGLVLLDRTERWRVI
jgi:hypothetical protein